MTESVGFDVNVGGNFGASLSQMIAQSDAYARSADTMIGKVAGLNAGITFLIGKTAALTGVSKVATAEAAAYQERLAGIAGTAKITGQSFDQLSKTTLTLARSTGNIGAAVQTVEALGTAGVTSAKSIDTLAKSWTNLGIANNTSGIALGRTMLDLGRTFGNSEKQLTSYGDSLTETSKKYGASADAAASYAKALAPVAANVGMTEGAVTGLGVAASRLGEDGFASVNAFSKVLLGMGNSMRNGTPEIKIYADALGMTQQNLAALFKSDPTEVLVRFTEAIGKGGPQAMRTLDALGLDAVRTVRSITALSSQGNLRSIINESTRAYGSGATAEVAGASLDTVNHQMQRLGETMSQTVAAAGKPFLGWLEGVLKTANLASNAIRGVVSSDLMQNLQKVAAPAGAAVGAAMNVTSMLALAGVGAVGLRAVGRARGRFGAAAEMEREGAMGPLLNDVFSRAGQRWGRAMPEPLFPGGLMPGMTMGQRLAAVGRGGINLAALGITSQARMIEGIRGREVPYSIPGEVARAGLRQTWHDPVAQAAAGLTGNASSIVDFGKKMEASGQIIASWSKEVSGSTTPLRNLGASLGQLGRSTVGASGALLGRGVQGVGKLADKLDISPAQLGITAGVAVAGAGVAWLRNRSAENQARDERMLGGMDDANAAFNEMAAAAGLAGRGLVNLSEQLQKTATDIARQSAATTPDTFTTAQAAAASMPGYERAFKTEARDPEEAAAIARATGIAGDPVMRARAATDIANQFPAILDAGQRFLDATKNNQGKTDYAGLVGSEGIASDAKGKLYEEVGTDLGMAMSRQLRGIQDVYGPESVNQGKAQISRQVYESTDITDSKSRGVASAQLAKFTGLDEQFVRLGMQAGMSWDEIVQAAGVGKLPTSALEKIGMGPGNVVSAGEGAKAFSQTITPVSGAGRTFAVNEGDIPGVQAARQFDNVLKMTTGIVGNFGKSMYAGEIQAGKLGTTFEGMTKANVASLDAADRLQAIARMNPEDPQAQLNATQSRAQQALRAAGGNRQLAAAALGGAAALRSEGPERQIYLSAQAQLNAGMGVDSRTQGLAQRVQTGFQVAKLEIGRGAQSMDESARLANIAAAGDMYGQQMDFQKQFVMASTQLDWQLQRNQEEVNKARKRSNEDYQTAVTDAEHDFHRSRMIATRDFNIQMQHAAEDAAKSIYDPYQRIQATMVADTTSLLGNLQEQNEAIRKQTSQVAQLRRMGLSQNAIDTLSLSDPKNAQQVSQMVTDMVTNPNLIKQMNSTIGSRLGASKAATQNENNVEFRRATEAFDLAMNDSAKNFDTQMGRMERSHRRSLARMAEDTQDSVRHAYEDLSRLGTDFYGGVETQARNFVSAIEKMPQSIQDNMSDQLKLIEGTAVSDAKFYLKNIADPGTTTQFFADIFAGINAEWIKAHDNASASYYKKHMGDDSHSGGGAYAPVGGSVTLPPINSNQVAQSLPHTAGQALAEGKSQDAHADRNWQGLCDRFVAVTYGLAHSGYNSAKDHWASIPGQYKSGTRNAPPGALYFWGNGTYGHTALSIGNGMVYSTDFVRKGQVDVTSEDSISRAWGDYRGWSYPYFGGKTARLSQGGIATRPINADIAELGGAEAVIPLNRGGANVLAEAMVRYVDSDKVHASQMNRFGTQVITYSYDHSTRVEGPITVQSNDPMDMAQKLEAKARQDRLAQPVGR